MRSIAPGPKLLLITSDLRMMSKTSRRPSSDLRSSTRLFLAVCTRGEVAAAVDAVFAVAEWSAGAHRVQPRGAFDLDDFSAEIREYLGGERPRPGPCQIGEANAFQEPRLHRTASASLPRSPSAGAGAALQNGGVIRYGAPGNAISRPPTRIVVKKLRWASCSSLKISETLLTGPSTMRRAIASRVKVSRSSLLVKSVRMARKASRASRVSRHSRFCRRSSESRSADG